MSLRFCDGVTVFSATKAGDREKLGDRFTLWLRSRGAPEVVRTVVTQSSDAEFHCLTITVFWRDASSLRRSP
jgi:hypothetical protein